MDTNNVYISFSGLGLKFENWEGSIHCFRVEIFWYGIIITAAIIAAVFMALRSCRKYDLTEDHVLDLVLFQLLWPWSFQGSIMWFSTGINTVMI